MADKKYRLLIIDDEVEVCEILKTTFQNDGYEVLVAYDGKSGFNQLEQNPPDCILLDVRMKRGEDGLTFLRRLRSFHHENPDFEAKLRKTPVIVLTGAGENMRPLFEIEGINQYIHKPYDSSQLKESVRSIVVSY